MTHGVLTLPSYASFYQRETANLPLMGEIAYGEEEEVPMTSRRQEKMRERRERPLEGDETLGLVNMVALHPVTIQDKNRMLVQFRAHQGDAPSITRLQKGKGKAVDYPDEVWIRREVIIPGWNIESLPKSEQVSLEPFLSWLE